MEKQTTFTVTGDESDIRKAIKEYISFAIKMPYIFKIVIVRITINKEDQDDNYYRWKGARKTKEEGIKYMKAWQCKFVHHGFNVDKNDETPFECVPNALFKMYGNRDAGRSKFIAPIADNGIDYVKQILDDDDVKTDNGLDENIESNNKNNNIEVKPNLDKYLEDIKEYEKELEELESDIIKRSEMRRNNILKEISYKDNYIHQANNIINMLKRNSYIKPYVNDILNGNYNKTITLINNDTFITCIIKPYLDEIKLYSDGFKIDIMNLKIELNKLDSTISNLLKIECILKE